MEVRRAVEGLRRPRRAAPARPDGRRRRSRVALDRPQRLGQVDPAAHGRRAPRAERRRRSRSRASRSAASRPGATTSFLPDDPVLYDDLSVREHLEYVAAPARRSTAGTTTSTSWSSGSGSWTGPTTCRPGSAAACGRRPSIARRPRAAVLAAAGRRAVRRPRRRRPEALLELLDEAHADGAAVVVATHEPALRRAGRPLHRAARRRGDPRRRGHRGRRAVAGGRLNRFRARRSARR